MINDISVLEYVLSVLGVDFDALAELAPAQVVVLLLGGAVVIFVLLFIIRGVLGGIMHEFR